MKIRYLGINSKHFSCSGVQLTAGQIGEFEEELGQKLLESYPQDLEAVESPEDVSDKDATPKSNKMAKKTASFKSK